MSEVQTSTAPPPTGEELAQWEETCHTKEQDSAALKELRGAVARLVSEVRHLRGAGLELLDRYRNCELDGIAMFPLSPDEEETLASEVARYRSVFEGRPPRPPLLH